MPPQRTSFGILLARLRERRRLSLRELGIISGVDHAYIHRLESGEKGAPSEDVVDRLVRHLKVEEREAAVLKILSEIDAPPDLLDLVLADRSIDLRDFQSAALMKYRGKARPKWPDVLRHIKTAREAIEGG
jgi:HTH-type transcriptional regulator, competence development regulator